jgi:hypothetical protein
MSRTDNTDPHWVRAIWWEPIHYRCDKAASFGTDYPCDLPPEPIVASQYGTRWRAHAHRQCAWFPTWDGARWGGGWSAPPWFCRANYTAPERSRVRDQMVRARQEYRADGEVDVIVDTAQHRHRACWDWN